MNARLILYLVILLGGIIAIADYLVSGLPFWLLLVPGLMIGVACGVLARFSLSRRYPTTAGFLAGLLIFIVVSLLIWYRPFAV